MPYTPLPEQTARRIKIFAAVMLPLSLLATMMSLLFILWFSFGGLIAVIILILFCIRHIGFLKAIYTKRALSEKAYKRYIISGFLAGVVCAFGFYILGTGSYDIDVQRPVAPQYFIMAFAGVPLITYFVLFSAYKWNQQFK